MRKPFETETETLADELVIVEWTVGEEGIEVVGVRSSTARLSLMSFSLADRRGFEMVAQEAWDKACA